MIVRQFYQIYTEVKSYWNGKDKTENTFRAALLNALSKYNFREFIPQNKNRYGFTEDVIRIANPEAEIKYGMTCQHVYVQVSVSDFSQLANLNAEVINTLENFFTIQKEENGKNEVVCSGH